MKNDSALISISLVLSVFALTCAGSTDDIFNDGEDSGEGGSETTGGGPGGPIFTGNGSSGVGSSGSAGAGSGAGAGAGGASSSSSSTTGVGGSSTGAGGAGGSAGGGPVDCANLPEGPFPYTVKLGQKASEDMDFDDAGNVVGSDSGNLFKSTFNGQSQIWVPGSGDFIAGLRFTSNGVLVYANVSANALFKIVPPATKTFVIGGLSYPNGMDADNDGRIVVAEQNANQVRRVNPETGEFDILATGLNNPNGVSFSPDYKTLYVGSFGGGIIYKITLDAQDKPISQGILIQSFSETGSFDGMGVDACGNVYVCEFGPAKVWRIPPDGQNPKVIVDLSAETGWIPNLQWGSGIGGWDPNVLYVRDISSGRMYEVPVGVPGKPRKYP
jgi:sugar lactone lactonase YvrE